MMHCAFGLDMSGYSQPSALAVAVRDGEQVKVTVLDGHCFGVVAGGSTSLAEKANEEAACLRRMMNRGPVYVDVPIDLQRLPHPDAPKYVWELTKRPVDRAFRGLCPLADRIGSCVARMQYLLELLREDSDPLGSRLLETYPAASLKLAGKASQGYKGNVAFRGGGWIGKPGEKAADQKKNDRLADLLNTLGWKAEAGFILNDDEFDAALCALCGVSDTLHSEELAGEINALIHDGNTYQAPAGYVLLKRVPQRVQVARRKFNGSMAEGEA